MYKNILYFGVYSHGNPRNAIIIKGLRSRGHTVIECRVRPGFLPFMYVRLLWHYLRMRPRFDRMIVGFPGAEVMLLAKMLTRKPIVFDAFSSAYLAYIIDRKYWKIGSLRSVWYRFIDRWSCRLADAVLLDTNAQINYFVREFRVSRNKFFKVLIGTDTDIFKPSTSHRSPSVCRVRAACPSPRAAAKPRAPRYTFRSITIPPPIPVPMFTQRAFVASLAAP